MDSDWLKNLKAGDEVAIKNGDYYGGTSIQRVDRLTPSGRIVISKRTFEAAGYERGGHSFSWGRAKLLEPTQEVRDKIDAERLAEEFRAKNWREVPVAKLREVAAMLK